MEFLRIEKIKTTKFPLKPILAKLSFEFGRNPVIEKREDWKKYIPDPYKAVLMISADFELAWAFRFSKTVKDPIENALKKARSARVNVPQIVELCEKFNIPITWATVGHLFLESCNHTNGLAHTDLKRLDYFESPFWKFDEGDWFKHDPCTDYKTNPEWYAPDLIKMIMASKVKHEIGSHTFSHIDCRKKVCPPEVFISELEKCQNVAQNYNLQLKSFVFPGHTFGNFDLLPDLGFTNYRTNYKNTIGYPEKKGERLWEHKTTAELVTRPAWSVKYQIYRYKKIIDRAIKNHSTCNLWFHPSLENQFVQEIMPSVFEHINARRDEIMIATMGQYTDWLINVCP